MNKLLWTFLLVHLQLIFVHAEPSVHILAENLDQVVTSTTLEWVPSNGDDKETLKNAVVAAYQTVEGPTENDAETTENDADNNGLVQKPVYVCRAKINSVWISGQLRPKKHVCVVSLFQKISEFSQFDILMSIEGSARLSWVHKNKYTLISQGAVTCGENIQRSFVARRPAISHDQEGSLSHLVGKFNPSDNLGMFYVVDQNNIEIQYEDGEILVETEPIRYEIKSIKYDRVNPRRHPRKQKILGQATLKNQESGLQRVESVISYNYTYSLFWGKGHGLLTGLPFKVSFSNGTQIDGSWAILKKEEKVELAPVERYLEEGTAVNVTVMGNYTESEIPYVATVVSIYKDGEKREITIRDTKRENKMTDIVAVYDPVYFIHNNSHVPTTTTTTSTSTTTTSTTTKTTSTTQEIVPVVVVTKKKTDRGQSTDKKHENGSMLSDDASSLKKKDAETGEIKSNSSTAGVLSIVALLTIAMMIRRVT